MGRELKTKPRATTDFPLRLLPQRQFNRQHHRGELQRLRLTSIITDSSMASYRLLDQEEEGESLSPS